DALPILISCEPYHLCLSCNHTYLKTENSVESGSKADILSSNSIHRFNRFHLSTANQLFHNRITHARTHTQCKPKVTSDYQTLSSLYFLNLRWTKSTLQIHP